MKGIENRQNRWIDRNFKLLFILIVILQIFILILAVQNNWQSWDKTLWFNAIQNMSTTGQIPYISSDAFVLGVSEYPVGFTYFLLLFLPFIFYLGYQGFTLIFGLVQILFYIGTG